MMLPLKYQAWYHYYQMMCEVLQLRMNYSDALLLDPNGCDRLVALSELSIRQSTGLQDYYENEIYFGDFVEVFKGDEIVYRISIESIQDLSLLVNHLSSGYSLKVIGNVYQHPNLLETCYHQIEDERILD
ncbi:YopX family protein [Brevibacillus sp. NPDC058079]|uniref:YopX family protein n=1 Tax=Brevibacillus sp. NPDC058079 TaxID=3346330 RepID=UPI0036E81158